VNNSKPLPFSPTYRPEIDGLRAIAVLSVCLFHAGVPSVSGGFVGVDVFFVISGYLITGIIQSSLLAGTFSIADFYARRARRILPALFVVLVTCSVVGYFLMLPSELKLLGRHVAATALFVSNITFFRESGYFDLSAELKPLLMTWSLGVEEQFYIVWPLLLWGAARWRVDPIRLVIGILVFSLFGASWAVRDHVSGTFFLLPSRAWELALGAVLALRPRSVGIERRWSWELCGVTGLLSIMFSVFTYDQNTVFPAYGALLPCLGAALVLWAGQNSRCNSLLLTNRPMRWLGRISYSLYLWHWPLFAFCRLLLNGELPLPLAIPLLLTAIGLAHLSWMLIEQRWRHVSTPVVPTLKAYGLSIAGVILLAATLVAVGKTEWRTGSEARRLDAASRDVNPLLADCHLGEEALLREPGLRCQFGSPSVRLVVWGDSHGDALSPGFKALAEEQGLGFIQLTKSGCPPIPGYELIDSRGKSYPTCRQFNQNVFDYILAHDEIEVVALVARWSIYAEKRHGIERNKPDMALTSEGTYPSSSELLRENIEQGIKELQNTLRLHGKKLVLVTQVADPGFNVPQCWARQAQLPAWIAGGLTCDLPYELAWKRIDPVNSILRRLAERPGAVLFDPAALLCQEGRCFTKEPTEDLVLYVDDDHLSRAAAIFVVQKGRFGQKLPRAD